MGARFLGKNSYALAGSCITRKTRVDWCYRFPLHWRSGERVLTHRLLFGWLGRILVTRPSVASKKPHLIHLSPTKAYLVPPVFVTSSLLCLSPAHLFYCSPVLASSPRGWPGEREASHLALVTEPAERESRRVGCAHLSIFFIVVAGRDKGRRASSPSFIPASTLSSVALAKEDARKRASPRPFFPSCDTILRSSGKGRQCERHGC